MLRRLDSCQCMTSDCSEDLLIIWLLLGIETVLDEVSKVEFIKYVNIS